jgi:Protein of unknown function (DUF2380)
MSRSPNARFTAGVLIVLAFVGLFSMPASQARAAGGAAQPAASVAFLGERLQNDNEGLEPTTDAEQARLKRLGNIFKSKLEASGRFKFVTVPPEVKDKIAKGQNIGDCNGCEVDFGKQLGADQIAWLTVQKVSNLILNMNVYMADVKTNKMTFIHSVDIRGNTDESWERSLIYLLDNYMLAPVSQ